MDIVGVYRLDKVDFEAYLKSRYFSELDYYETKSKLNKQYCQMFQIIIIIFSVMTPIFLSMNMAILQTGAILLSGIVAITTSVLSTFKFQENWLNYRSVAESLKKEKSFYDSKNCDYTVTDDPEKLFIFKVENLISKEHNTWTNYYQTYREFSKPDENPS